jgi:hypothetical protein
VVDQQQRDDRAVYRAVGVLASLTSPRAGIAIAGALILATPVLLPRPRRPGGKVSLTPEPLA